MDSGYILDLEHPVLIGRYENVGRIGVFLVKDNCGQNIDFGWVYSRVPGGMAMDGSRATSKGNGYTCLALGRSRGLIVPIGMSSGVVAGGLSVRYDGEVSLVKRAYGLLCLLHRM